MAGRENQTLSETARSELAALDAALCGEAVAPEHGDLADLAALLREDRPRARPELLERLDEQAAARITYRGKARGGRAQPGRATPARRRAVPLRRGLLPAIVVAVAILIVPASLALLGRGATRGVSTSAGAAGASSGGGATSDLGPATRAPFTGTKQGTNDGVVTTPAPRSAPAVPAPPGATPQAVTRPRAVQRTATLELGVASRRLETIDQQVFAIVNSFRGYVQQSSATSGTEQQGSASFQLRLPSADVSGAIAALSQLGRVLSETNTTNDVTEQLSSLQRSLGDARAERSSLLAQLAATSEAQRAASLRARLAAVDGRISRLEGSLGSVENQISYTPIALSLTGERGSGAGAASTGDLTPSGALHDAGAILSAALAVMLLAVAAALPIALAWLLVWGAVSSLRRRQREHALDSGASRASP